MRVSPPSITLPMNLPLGFPPMTRPRDLDLIRTELTPTFKRPGDLRGAKSKVLLLCRRCRESVIAY